MGECMVINDNKSIIKFIGENKLIIISIILIILIFHIYYPFLDNTYAISIWTQTSDSDFNNGTCDNISILNIGKLAELRLESQILNRWDEKSPTNKPSTRSDMGIASIWGTDKVLLFGGRGSSPQYKNKTWIYNLNNNTWIEKKPKNFPSARAEKIMASIWGTDKVLLFGGTYTDGVTWYRYNDTWIYDMSDNNWTQMSPDNNPEQLWDCEMTPIWGTDKVLYFGSLQTSQETWVYDLSKDNWTKQKPSNDPGDRCRFALASIWGTDKAVLFGGDDFTNYRDDLWVYDLSKDEWTKKNVLIRPNGRHRHSMATIYGSDKVLLFGGWNGSYRNDTWIYDLNDNTWKKISSILNPSKRNEHGMVSIYGTDKVLFFGGSDNSKNYNDTWIFDLISYTKNGTYISPPNYTGTNSIFKKIIWTGNISTNTSIKFQIRTDISETNLLLKNFIGPEGTPTSFYTTSDQSIWSGHHGDSWCQYIAYFNTINGEETPILKNVTIKYNLLPNTTLFNPTNNSITSNNKPTFNWNFTDLDSKQQTAFQVLIDDDFNFQNIDYNSKEQTSISHNWQFPTGTSYTELPDGIWYWKVRTKDSDGDWGLYSQPWKIIIDTIQPSSKIINPLDNQFYNNLDIISGTALETIDGTGIHKVEIIIKGVNEDNYWDGSTWGTSENWLLATGTKNWSYNASSIEWNSNNQYLINSLATDNASNVEVLGKGIFFYFDADNVVFSNPYPLPTDVSSSNNVKVGITISDLCSGVNGSTIEYAISTDKGANWGSWIPVPDLENGKNIDINLNLTLSNGIGNRIKWHASDIAGNGPTESEAYVVKIDISLQELIPKVELLFPTNNSIITLTSVELKWELISTNLTDVVYDIILDTTYPPIEIFKEEHIGTTLSIDNLEDKTTYYWTVTPNIGLNEGICLSGIWSFSVEYNPELPWVTLKSPENGATIDTLEPTLSWLVQYEGFENVTYDIYFSDKSSILSMLVEKHPNTQYAFGEELEDGKTYYWMIMPRIRNLYGFESETWSFTIDIEYSPKFDFNLTLKPSILELKPGENSTVEAIVTNLGDSKDKITLSIKGLIEPGVLNRVLGNKTKEVDIGSTIEFEFIVEITPDTKNKEVQLIVEATSEIAPIYDLTVIKTANLTVRILKETPIDGVEKSTNKGNFTALIIAIIVIIIIVIILILYLFIKKKKKSAEEPSPSKLAARSIQQTPLSKIQQPIPQPPQPTLQRTPTVQPLTVTQRPSNQSETPSELQQLKPKIPVD